MAEAAHRMEMSPGKQNPKGNAVSRIKFAIYLVFSFFIIPLSFCTQAVDPVLSLRFILLGLLVLLLGIFSLIQSFDRQGCAFLKVPGTIVVFLSGYFLVNLFSLNQAVNKSEGFFECAKVFLFCSFVWFSSSVIIESGDRIRSIAKAVTSGALVVAVLGVLEYWGIVRLIDAGWVGPGATMVNRNLLSSYLFLCLGFILYMCIDQKGFWRYVGLFSYAILFYCLLATQTRAVWVAVAVSSVSGIVIVSCTGLLRKVIKNILMEKKLWAVIAVIPLVCGVFISTLKPPEVAAQSLMQRLSTIKNMDFDSNRERIRLWRKTAAMISDHAILGVGAGNWKIEAPGYGTGDLISPDMKIIETRPYNDFLLVFAETGIAGIVFYLGLFVLCAWFAVRCVLFCSDRSMRVIMITMFMTLTGYAVISIFDFPKERIEHLVLLGTVFAICAGPRIRTSPPAGIARHLKCISLVTILLMCGTCVGAGIMRLKGDIHAAGMLRAFHAGDFKAVIAESDRAFSFMYTMEPSSTPLHWYRGVAEFKLGNTGQALDDYLRANRYNPHHIHILNDLGTCYSLKGDHILAQKNYLAALDISPYFGSCLINLSAEYYNTGRNQEALHMLMKCKPPRADPRFDSFYKAITDKIAKGEKR
jgi:O-antigen ligase